MEIINLEKKNLIVGVGWHKTGTSSLRRALRILDYRVKDTATGLIIPILKCNFKPIFKTLEKYDAVEDIPWFMIYKEIDQRIPNCKFILTIRDEDAWYKSVSKHVGDLRTLPHEWIYGRHFGIPKENREHAIQTYRNHNQEVMEYFKDRPNDLLIMDITKGDGWEKLCPFLGRAIPTEDFPHNNRTKWNKNKYSKVKFYKKKYKDIIRLKYLDFFDMWDKC